MRQLEKFSDSAISSEATWQQAERSQTTQSNLPLDGMGTSAERGKSLEDMVGTVMKVTEVRIKSLAITTCGMTMHHGIGAMAGGGLCSQIQPAAAALGLSAGALIHLVR